jgi:hypothetical protein
MNAVLDELEAVPATPVAERQRGVTQTEAARAWERFLRERGRSETLRTAPRRWRDEEGL